MGHAEHEEVTRLDLETPVMEKLLGIAGTGQGTVSPVSATGLGIKGLQHRLHFPKLPVVCTHTCACFKPCTGWTLWCLLGTELQRGSARTQLSCTAGGKLEKSFRG